METIISRRSVHGFYFPLLLWCLFYSFMALMIGGIFIRQYNSTAFEARNYGLVPLFILVVTATIYTIHRFLKSSPHIELDSQSITFNGSAVYFWKDLEKMELSGKRPFLLGTEKEGVKLKFEVEKERIFLDSMYANTSEIKKFIQCVVIDKVNYVGPEITEPTVEEATNEQFVVYKGSQFVNFYGILLWLIMSGLLYVSILNIEHWRLVIFFILIFSVLVSRLVWFLHYVELSEHYIQIRNHNLFWTRKLYRLSDIQEVVFEQPTKMPVCIRIITKDFESKTYPAATLWGKTWRQLKRDVEAKSIKVRNECVSEDEEPIRFKFFND